MHGFSLVPRPCTRRIGIIVLDKGSFVLICENMRLLAHREGNSKSETLDFWSWKCTSAIYDWQPQSGLRQFMLWAPDIQFVACVQAHPFMLSVSKEYILSCSLFFLLAEKKKKKNGLCRSCYVLFWTLTLSRGAFLFLVSRAPFWRPFNHAARRKQKNTKQWSIQCTRDAHIVHKNLECGMGRGVCVWEGGSVRCVTPKCRVLLVSPSVFYSCADQGYSCSRGCPSAL